MLTAIHRLLRGERERLRPRIANLGFDRECHPSPSPSQMSTIGHPWPHAFAKAPAGQVRESPSHGLFFEIVRLIEIGNQPGLLRLPSQ
jgi:hypothetical protein